MTAKQMIGINLDDRDYLRLKLLCLQRRISMSLYVRSLILKQLKADEEEDGR